MAQDGGLIMRTAIKFIIVAILIVTAFISGHTAGSHLGKDVADIAISDAGVLITYTDGTGYWCEYDENGILQVK